MPPLEMYKTHTRIAYRNVKASHSAIRLDVVRLLIPTQRQSLFRSMTTASMH